MTPAPRLTNTVYRRIQTYTGAEFYTPFSLHPEGSQRDYWLIHLSKHHKAREEMGKVHWSMENTFEHFGGPGFDALGFDPGVDARSDMFEFGFNDNARTRSQAAVLTSMPRLIHAARDRTLTKREIFSSRCNETPITGDTVDSQLALLRDEKEIVITSSKGATRRSATSFAWDGRIQLVSEPSLFSTINLPDA